MDSKLEHLLEVRSRRTQEVKSYLKAVARNAAPLPEYFPEHLRPPDQDEDGATGFDDIRQRVRVVDHTEFERGRAEESERLHRAGQAYFGPRSVPQPGEQEDRPAPPEEWDADALVRHPQVLLLGEPGAGKSWLVRNEARSIAGKGLQAIESRRIPVDDLLLPIHLRLDDLAVGEDAIEEALSRHAAQLAKGSKEFEVWVESMLAKGRAAVLLDAWDEVRPEHRESLWNRLESWEFNPALRLMLTSRVVGYDSAPVKPRSVEKLRLLPFDREEIDAFVDVWFADEQPKGERLLDRLKGTDRVSDLARIPLMLTLICRLWSESVGTPEALPSRRSDLYDRCLRGLLKDWRREKRKRITDAEVRAHLRVLEELALKLSELGLQQFTVDALCDHIAGVLTGLTSSKLASSAPEDLVEAWDDFGLLVKAGEESRMFLHLTFQEYLSACALARRVGADWESVRAWLEEEPAHRREAFTTADHGTLWRFGRVDAARWHEVVVLLAGLLGTQDAHKLLTWLAEENGDDWFQGRLALAAECAGELKGEVRKELSWRRSMS